MHKDVFAGLILGMVCVCGVVGCPPSPPGPVTPAPDADGAPAPPGPVSLACAAACAQMAKVGCATGQDPACAAALTHIDSAGNVPRPGGAPITCASLAQAATIEAMRAAGGDCP